jgi:hypothetical protein
MSWISSAKKTIKNRQKWQDDRGLNLKKNYSSFWMDDDKNNRFSGISTGEKGDIVRLVKLVNYRKAVTNFVKIVTNQEIPVTWAGSNSYTDGKSINLTTDIKETNFDVVVGLALHEASHIVLSDFELLKKLQQGNITSVEHLNDNAPAGFKYMSRELVKDILNWIEDRRIDNFIFSTSPGYKAYYHKMYDHYWNSKDIHKGFLSTTYADSTKVDNWLFQIINSLNPSFNPKIFPGLQEVVDIINVRNIKRLKSTEEALDVAVKVVEIILEHAAIAQQDKQDKANNASSTANDNTSSTEDTADNKADDNSEDVEVNEDNAGEDLPEISELSPAEEKAIAAAYAAQKSFLAGDTKKKATTKKLQKQLDGVTKGDLTIQAVGEGANVATTAVLSDLTNSALVGSWINANQNYEATLKLPYSAARNAAYEVVRDFQEVFLPEFWSRDNKDAVKAGLEIGALLGKKLQLHNESRERVDNRLRNGKIDIKRIAHAGYGIESIFKQIQVDKYKQANMHISIDASGSMCGRKWNATMTAVAAIGKALTYTQNIALQVSLRYEKDNKPMIITIYNSKKNKIAHLVRLLEKADANNTTPEGLCFEAMYKQNQLIAGTSDLDSYFLNFSDGEPSCGGYSGPKAHKHTATWINKMKSDLNMKVLSFFISNQTIDTTASPEERVLQLEQLQTNFKESYTGAAFRTMYGPSAVAVDVTSVVDIAKSLNKTFLSTKG